MDLSLLTNIRRPAGGKDVDAPEGDEDEESGCLELGGDSVLDLEDLLNGFTNLERRSGGNKSEETVGGRGGECTWVADC